MNGFQNPKINETAVAMPKDMAYSSEGVNILRLLDEYMLPNPFTKMSQGYPKQRTCEKREDNSWYQNIKHVKNWKC